MTGAGFIYLEQFASPTIQVFINLHSTQSQLSILPYIQAIHLAKPSNVILKAMKDALAALVPASKITHLKISSPMWFSAVLGQELAQIQVLDMSNVMVDTMNIGLSTVAVQTVYTGP